MKKIITVLILSTFLTFFASFQFASAATSSFTSTQKVEIIRPGEGETFRMGEDLITFKTFNKDIPGETSFIEITAAPQSGPSLHKHPPETFYILEGEFQFYGSRPEETIKAKAGDLIHIPADVPHAYKNTGTTPGKYLLVSAMAGTPEHLWFQKFEYEISQDLGTPVTNKSSLPTTSKSLDSEKMAAIAHKYEIEFLN